MSKEALVLSNLNQLYLQDHQPLPVLVRTIFYTLQKLASKLLLTIFPAVALRSARSAAETERSLELSFAHELQQEQAPASAKLEHILAMGTLPKLRCRS